VYTLRPFPWSVLHIAARPCLLFATGDNVNKADLTKHIADKADISNASAARALDAALEGIADALRSGDQVALLGFGTFLVKERAARQGRNPKSGETMTIAASRVAGFKPGKALRDALN